MDQAVIMGARAGAAAHVSFAPLEIELVPVPASWTFVVAHSLEEAAKSGHARHIYNERTEESRLAFRIMAGEFGLDETIREYGALIDEVGPEVLIAEAERRLDSTRFRRLRHIVTETDRVFDAVDALGNEDLFGFGPLLLDCHRSLRDDYEVSTGALDELVETAVGAGAVGARLTGAGLGGCAIAVCEGSMASQVIESLSTNFYERRGVGSDIDDVLFPVYPSDGASVVSL